MAWLRYDEYGIVNLDKITRIYIGEVDTRKLAIHIYDGGNNTYYTKVYSSWNECRKALDNLTRQLASNAQYIDITDI